MGCRFSYFVLVLLLSAIISACGSGGGSSSSSTPTTTSDTTAPTTTASPAGGTYSSAQTVTLTANETATIYYTTDGTTPTTGSTVYTGAISISAGTTLKYFAVDSAGNSESVKTETYVISVVKVPDTGQTTSHTATFGEDSDYTINPPSYTDNGDYTISDNVTGLMWQKCSVGQANDASCSGTATTHNWYEATGTTDATYNAGGATNVCGSLSLAGNSDWRLPKPFELMLIADNETSSPSINSTYFPSTVSSYYWAATTHANSTSTAWDVSLDIGFVSNGTDNKSSSFYVRCVRGTENGQGFTDNGDGTVTDNVTTMMWQKCSNGQNATDCSGTATTSRWESAITYCEGLSLAGNVDWRLPNKNELASIVDYSVYGPAISGTYFPSTVSSHYWSATTYASNTSSAWHVLFSYGNVGGSSKSSSSLGVRCVR